MLIQDLNKARNVRDFYTLRRRQIHGNLRCGDPIWRIRRQDATEVANKRDRSSLGAGNSLVSREKPGSEEVQFGQQLIVINRRSF